MGRTCRSLRVRVRMLRVRVLRGVRVLRVLRVRVLRVRMLRVLTRVRALMSIPLPGKEGVAKSPAGRRSQVDTPDKKWHLVHSGTRRARSWCTPPALGARRTSRGHRCWAPADRQSSLSLQGIPRNPPHPPSLWRRFGVSQAGTGLPRWHPVGNSTQLFPRETITSLSVVCFSGVACQVLGFSVAGRTRAHAAARRPKVLLVLASLTLLARFLTRAVSERAWSALRLRESASATLVANLANAANRRW